MSITVSNFLKQNPQLINYAKIGLLNLNALSRFIKENSKEYDDSLSIAAIGMDLRRYLSKLPTTKFSPIDFAKYSLQLVVRTNINEAILNKNSENRKWWSEIVNRISQTKYFVSIVEGEKELVLITDYPLKELLTKEQRKNISHQTDNLGFVSINFPMELRLVPGIYQVLTSTLAEAQISIHSFHTIGGEILILVSNNDLAQTQEVLTSLLTTNP